MGKRKGRERLSAKKGEKRAAAIQVLQGLLVFYR
jgi:hypothetical protein